MCGGIRNAFDFDGDGKLNGVEMAIAYTVLFGNDNEKDSAISYTEPDESVDFDLCCDPDKDDF